MIMDGEEVVEERVAKDEEMVGPSSACGNEEPDISLESAIDMENEQTLEEDEQPAYNEDHSLVETAQDALRQLHDLKDPHGITTLADDLDGEGGVSIATDSIDESFERERSIIEEEEEEEANIDRELSCEPGCNIDDEEEDEGSGTNHIHLLGDEDKHDFDRSRSIVNRQYNCSPSGRWDKPLRPSDFGEHVFPAARTQALEYETEENIRDEAEEGSSSEEESESVGENVVTITSSDPLAAARAAAILKLVSNKLHYLNCKITDENYSTIMIIFPGLSSNAAGSRTWHSLLAISPHAERVLWNPAFANFQLELEKVDVQR